MEMEAPAGLRAESRHDNNVERILWLLGGEPAVKRSREKRWLNSWSVAPALGSQCEGGSGRKSPTKGKEELKGA